MLQGKEILKMGHGAVRASGTTLKECQFFLEVWRCQSWCYLNSLCCRITLFYWNRAGGLWGSQRLMSWGCWLGRGTFWLWRDRPIILTSHSLNQRCCAGFQVVPSQRSSCAAAESEKERILHKIIAGITESELARGASSLFFLLSPGSNGLWGETTLALSFIVQVKKKGIGKRKKTKKNGKV